MELKQAYNRIYVVRSSDDSDVIIVEQDNGQVTAYDNDTVIYVEK